MNHNHYHFDDMIYNQQGGPKTKKIAVARAIARNSKQTDCLIKMPGRYVDEVNWITGKGTPDNIRTVEAFVENQGDCSVCWAWGGAKGAEAAIRGTGEDVPALSVQDVVDHAYPGMPGCRGGNALVALNLIEKQGVSEEARYNPYTGIKPAPTPPRHAGPKHKINSYHLIKDDENSMLQSNRNQAIIVSVPCYSAFVDLEGKGLFDLVEAEKNHDPDDEPCGHTLLLVGFGTFFPSDKTKKPIKYWIVKNQWDVNWGYQGLAYVIRNSSLLELHSNTRITRNATVRLDRIFSPSVAIKGDHLVTPSNIMKQKSVKELMKFVTSTTYLKTSLLYIFYNPTHCNRRGIDIDAEVNALERAYATDLDKLIALIDINVLPGAPTAFKFDKKDGVVFLVFKPDPFRRTVKDAIRFPKNQLFNFGNMLSWLGDRLDMAPCPYPNA